MGLSISGTGEASGTVPWVRLSAVPWGDGCLIVPITLYGMRALFRISVLLVILHADKTGTLSNV
jgi:hypothetical protein